jgi:hypothetical protein
MENLRRIITGHNKNGKSIVMIDGKPSRIIGEDVGGLFENGTKFRYFAIHPTPDGIPKEKLEAAAALAFEKIGAAHERIDTSKHHAMHQTKTIDYIILLEGDVTLLLDEDEVQLKPFNVVVQRGTNHAWVNNGTEPALLIAVLIDSEFKE